MGELIFLDTVKQSKSHPILLDTLALELDFDLDSQDYLIEQLRYTTMIRITIWNGVGYDSYELSDVYNNENFIHFVPLSSSSKALGSFVCDSESSL